MKKNKIKNYLEKTSVYEPKYLDKIDFNKKLNFVTIFCPFVRRFKNTNKYIFSEDILYINKIINKHFTLENSSYVQVNPKAIALSWEIPHIIMDLIEINADFSWRILIADELKDNMVADQQLENIARKKMLKSAEKALSFGLKTLIPFKVIKNVSVELTTELEFDGESISCLIDQLSGLYSKTFFQKTILGENRRYLKELEKQFLMRYSKSESFVKEKSFKEAAYRSVLAEFVRRENTVFISAQPPEIGDEFHGALTSNVMPTLFLIKNVEGVNKIDDVFRSRFEKQKFIKLLAKEL